MPITVVATRQAQNQLGNTPNSPSSTLAPVQIANLTVSGVMGTAALTVNVNSAFVITQTTANIIVTAPTPTAPIGSRTITLHNAILSTTSVFWYGINIAPGQSGDAFWNGATWSGVGAGSNVLAEFGENNGITNAQIVPATFTDVAGSSFTLPNAGTWEVTYSLTYRIITANNSIVAKMTDSANVDVPNSSIQYFSGGTAGTGALTTDSQTVRITTNASTTYKLRALSGAGTGTIYNTQVTSAGATEGTSKITWKKIAGNTGVSSVSGAVQGQIEFMHKTADFSDWILLDGRLKSTLTVAQQAVATGLGYVANLPDMRGKMAIGANATYPYQTTGGSNTIAQNQLPNVSPTITDPGHTHTATGQFWYFTGSNNITLNGTSFPLNAPLTPTINSSTTGITIGSINGGVAQQTFTPAYISGNWFVWLGVSATTVTTPTALTLTTTGTGLPTLIGGALNIPNIGIPTIKIFNSSGTYTPTTGLKYAVVEMVGAGGGGGGAVGALTQVGAGGGGASGSYIKALLTTAQIGATQTVTIGTGGVGATGNVAGTTGGNTLLGTLLTAVGGTGGGGSANNATNGAIVGGTGGLSIITTGIDLGSSAGRNGFNSLYFPNVFVQSGRGADSKLGVGAVNAPIGNTASATGLSAQANTGGGGSGAMVNNQVASITGGNGGSGKIIITEYF